MKPAARGHGVVVATQSGGTANKQHGTKITKRNHCFCRKTRTRDRGDADAGTACGRGVRCLSNQFRQPNQNYCVKKLEREAHTDAHKFHTHTRKMWEYFYSIPNADSGRILHFTYIFPHAFYCPQPPAWIDIILAQIRVTFVNFPISSKSKKKLKKRKKNKLSTPFDAEGKTSSIFTISFNI